MNPMIKMLARLVPIRAKQVAAKLPKPKKLSDTGLNTVFEHNLAAVENPELQLLLKEGCAIAKPNEPLLEKKIHTIVDDIIHKLDMCEDRHIKESAEKILSQMRGAKREEQYRHLIKAEQLLDAVNTAQQKYSVHSFSSSYLHDCRMIRSDSTFAFRRKVKTDTPEFEIFSRFSSMRTFIENNTDEHGIGKYLWEKYFLPFLRQGKGDGQIIINKLKELEQKFGTLTFIDRKRKTTKTALNFVKKEFELQKKTGGEEAKITPYLHITRLDRYYLVDPGMDACCRTMANGKSFIKVRSDENINSLRHETEHFLDKIQEAEDKPLKIAMSKISKFKVFSKIRTWFNVKKQLWQERKEMKKAGIEWQYRRYSKENNSERKAVFVQGDMEKYSDKLKQRMIKDGVPEFMTRLPQHTNDFRFKILKKRYQNDKKSMDIIVRLNKLLGNIPDILFNGIINNKKVLKSIEKELAYYGKNDTVDANKFVTKFFIRQGISNISKRVSKVLLNAFIKPWKLTYNRLREKVAA